MKNKLLILTFTLFSVALFIAIVIFLFWRLGILKKEAELSQIVKDVQSQIEFINNYPFQSIPDYLKNLPTQVLQLPTISPEEIGRPSLF